MYSHRYFAEIDPPWFVPAFGLIIGVIFAATLHLFIATWLRRVLSTTQRTPAPSSSHDQPRPAIPYEQPCPRFHEQPRPAIPREQPWPLLHEQLCPALPHEQPCGQARKGEVSRRTTIETLPDDMLIDIFNLYRHSSVLLSRVRPWEWHRLVHVCRRWRSIIFDSPHYFDLRTFCTYAAPVRDILDHWTFPIVLQYAGFSSPSPLATGDEHNIVVALQQTDRLHTVQLTVTILLLEILATQPQGLFPALENLELVTHTEAGLTLPDACFGGSAPNLRILRLAKIGFPALPRLLLSAENLVSLQLEAIPSTGYISPEDLIVSLHILTRLTTFNLHFLSPTSRPISGEHQPPQRRAVLPALKYFAFRGVSEYLESLVSGIDTPLLKYLFITFFNQVIIFDIPKLSQFVCRTETQSSPGEARVYYSGKDISIILTRGERPHRMELRVRCVSLDWQLSCMAEICESLSLILSGVQQLDISASSQLQIEQDNPDPLPLLDLFHPFSNVERLRVAKEAASHVACALGQEHVGMEVLPALHKLYIEGHSESTLGQQGFAPFITMRRHSNRPVIVRHWEPNNGFQPLARGSPAPAILRYDPILELEEEIRGICNQFDAGTRPFAVQSLFQQAQSLLLSFMQSGRLEDLENSIEISQDLLEMHTKQIPRVKLFGILAFSFALRSQWSGNMARSISMFEAAFRDEFATTTEKLGIAWWWAVFTRAWDHPSTTLAYQDTLSALQDAIIGRFTIPIQPISIGGLGSVIQVPFEYASYQIGSGQLELAVETIEQGKTLIWSEMYGLRISEGRLRRFNPDLADRLMTVSQDLGAVNNSIPVHGATGSPLYARGDHEDVGIFSPTLREQQRLLGEYEKVIREIQAQPGFENFMKAIPFRTLQNAASCGPIIIVNHCRWRCDILIIIHDSPPSLIPTRAGFFERATVLATHLADIRHRYRLESEGYNSALRSVLKELYEHIGQPVIDRLQELGIPEQSRVWWYPTSVFCSLPLHAMGPIAPIFGRGQYFSDIYVCSYTPTLSALIEARSPATAIPDPVSSLLLVGQPRMSIPGVEEEIAAIRSTGIPVTMVVGRNATRQAVIERLQKHRIVHFACHGILEAGNSFNAALKLGGDDRLTLLDMIRTRVPSTELAVLSAEHTAELAEGADLIEGLHLAAAMQYYGFRSVVGTMWAMTDGDGRDFSDTFYEALLSQVVRDGGPLGKSSAEALRLAVQTLRKKSGITLDRWVGWVHYGA